MTYALTEEQNQHAIEVMRSYLSAPKNPDGRTPKEVQTERDQKRVELINTVLRPLLTQYLAGHISLPEFKSEVDSINKRHTYWGFKGVKGQMFFNMIVNSADEEGELTQELQAAITEPTGEEIAGSRIKTFSSYVKRLGDHVVETGGTLHGRPNTGSVPFFLSYFWQIQDPKKWPVYYTNSVQVMIDLNLWQPTTEAAADYLTFKQMVMGVRSMMGVNDGGQVYGFLFLHGVSCFHGAAVTDRVPRSVLSCHRSRKRA